MGVDVSSADNEAAVVHVVAVHVYFCFLCNEDFVVRLIERLNLIVVVAECVLQVWVERIESYFHPPWNVGKRRKSNLPVLYYKNFKVVWF